MNDQSVESTIQAKGLTAPRITPADIEANIVWPLMRYALKQQLANATRSPWCCASCCQSFPDGIPATCPNKAAGCNELLAQGK